MNGHIGHPLFEVIKGKQLSLSVLDLRRWAGGLFCFPPKSVKYMVISFGFLRPPNWEIYQNTLSCLFYDLLSPYLAHLVY